MLTDKQHNFALGYIQHGDTYKAAVDAGYSERYARHFAHKLLDLEGIAKLIAAGTLPPETDPIKEVAAKLLNIARGNISDLYEDWGTLKPFADVTPEAKARIASIQTIELKSGQVVYKVENLNQLTAMRIFLENAHRIQPEKPLEEAAPVFNIQFNGVSGEWTLNQTEGDDEEA